MKLRKRMSVVPSLLAFCAIPVLAATTVQLNVKPGLWETTSTTHLEGSMIPESTLEKLPPEQRQRMEAAIAEAQKPHTAQKCLSRDSLMKDFANSSSKDCKWEFVTNTPSTLEYRGACNRPDSNGSESSQIMVHLKAINPELVKGRMQFSVSRNDKPVTSGSGIIESKWLGSSCGSVK